MSAGFIPLKMFLAPIKIDHFYFFLGAGHYFS